MGDILQVFAAFLALALVPFGMGYALGMAKNLMRIASLGE